MLLGQTSRCIHCFQNYSQHTFHIYTCPSVSFASEPHDAQNTQKIMRSNLPQVVQFIYVRVIICAMMCNNKIHILEGELSPCKASQEASQAHKSIFAAKNPCNNCSWFPMIKAKLYIDCCSRKRVLLHVFLEHIKLMMCSACQRLSKLRQRTTIGSGADCGQSQPQRWSSPCPQNDLGQKLSLSPFPTSAWTPS